MQAEELRDHMRQRPFVPFRLYVSDGRTFDILYPEIHGVRKPYFDVGIPPEDGSDPFADFWLPIPLDAIEKIELIPDAVLPRSILRLQGHLSDHATN